MKKNTITISFSVLATLEDKDNPDDIAIAVRELIETEVNKALAVISQSAHFECNDAITLDHDYMDVSED